MLIRSQDKEILANMEGPIAIEILSDGKGHFNHVYERRK